MTSPDRDRHHHGSVLEAEVTLTRPSGAYDVVSLAVPSDPVWERCRPGQFLVLPGDLGRGEPLPTLLWVAGVSVDPLHGTAVEVVLPAAERHRLTDGRRHRLLGPLGRGFGLPAHPVPVLVAGHEAATVPLRWLVPLLRERGSEVHLVLSADDPDRHLDVGLLRRQAATVVLTDGAELGPTVARRLDEEQDVAVVYAAGSRDQVHELAGASRQRGRVSRVLALDLQEPVLCGTGLCGQCDLLVEAERSARLLRACLEGPVVPGELVADAAR
ncbi:Dihydroorotate dehydrogenase electron transfer subunit [Serinicoccus hydrothermalis]|uniref:Dihydroorotate dehydrogenase electron transfer subunit n=1 Tax=Serinicoccus hydrothermalis TaxID=1758689 RepID=A0A1B1N836_9MICO|nr:hypothetical protein [Serinicoccus hydrothermalis]ANS77590.1 Dihydroorotate dehydrogenase electron transfer subunit [Serinicoccus hydrothermalis]